jgi:glycosyltransferase involved in cell wall biosynthesis
MIDDKNIEIRKHDSNLECILHHLPKKNITYALPKHIKTKFHKRLVNKYVDAFICPSNNLCKFYYKKFPNTPTHYIPNFIPADLCQTPITNKFNILFTGRLSKEKGVDILIKGFVKASKLLPDLNLTIIGNGPEEQNLKTFVSEQNLEKHIKFLGKVKHEDLYKYYKNAAAIIIPSIWIENCPMVALEAIGSNKPLIASNAGGLKDLIKNNETGYLFNRADYHDLSIKIIKLFSSPEIISKFASNQEKLIERYTAKRHVKDILRVYESVINS